MLALSLRNLKKTYDNGIIALNGINLDVKQKDFFALLGPNGAGKSTTIGIVCSLVRKDSGTVTVFGDSMDEKPNQVKAHIGVVPQEFNFNPFNTVENIIYYQACYYGLPSKIASARVKKVLEDVELWEKRTSSAKDLSGGMKRRLMIARALVHEPRLLILDEPTAGVDIEIRRSMWEFLKNLNQQGTTIILTTHYLEEAEQLCNRIAIINQGDIVEDTHKKALLSKLRNQTLILDLQGEHPQQPELAHFVSRWLDNSTLEVDLQAHQNLNDLFHVLSTQSLNVNSLRNKANRLEEIFVNAIHATKPEKSKQ